MEKTTKENRERHLNKIYINQVIYYYKKINCWLIRCVKLESKVQSLKVFIKAIKYNQETL
jgi:hypothetical protein